MVRSQDACVSGPCCVELYFGVFLYYIHGIKTFRSSVFSLLGAKVPTENFRSRERKFSGTFVPGNESSGELSFPSKQVCFLTKNVINIYNTQMLGAAVKKVHIFD